METHSFVLSFFDHWRSKRNRLFFTLRKRVAFSRAGYKEVMDSHTLEAWLQKIGPGNAALCKKLEEKYELTPYKKFLSLTSWQKNLATLWILDSFLESPEAPMLLEVGVQDFQRAPAIRSFFAKSCFYGLELDAFRVLQDFHSRADRAKYFANITGSTFMVGDFFTHRGQYDFILAFYPFVSPHPALAWGLPAEIGSAEKWINAIAQNLASSGSALVLHQGKWEEEEFDEALAQNPSPLRLVKREVLDCPFYPLPHPAHGSLYTLAKPC